MDLADRCPGYWDEPKKYDKILQLVIACACVGIPAHIVTKRDIKDGKTADLIDRDYVKRILCRNIFLVEEYGQTLGDHYQFLLAQHRPEFAH